MLSSRKTKCGEKNNIFTIHFFTYYFFYSGDNDQGCLGDNYCPPKCTCIGTVVRCTRAKLTEIPKNVPVETSEL